VIGITDEQLAGLRQLAPALETETYLAGGVAIAMAYGHRTLAMLPREALHVRHRVVRWPRDAAHRA